ncbi:vegetative cell wall protein gp1-like [Sarcophilus harrisii]|uniref:vegetative cell wall protein gp1-like n=1 Tax=Sarcophilus harrisii TaxID=9305 RepID=UPI001301E29E|nr:vegetative cell wall protein gp1-like [Sarcophilus harrisii]
MGQKARGDGRREETRTDLQGRISREVGCLVRKGRSRKSQNQGKDWRVYIIEEGKEEAAAVAPGIGDIRAEWSRLRHPPKKCQGQESFPPPPLSLNPRRTPSRPPAPSPRTLLPPHPREAAAAAANFTLYPVPMVPPSSATARSQPRCLGAAELRRAAPTAPVSQPASQPAPGSRERQHAAVPRPAPRQLPLDGRKRLSHLIGPALMLNGPMGFGVSGRHRDRCC